MFFPKLTSAVFSLSKQLMRFFAGNERDSGNRQVKIRQVKNSDHKDYIKTDKS